MNVSLLYQNLSNINGIYFTIREIDIIACVLNNRGNKKIAELLTISTKTVETHVHNICIKIQGSTRESIIDFVYKYRKQEEFKLFYHYMLVDVYFVQQLSYIKTNIIKEPLNLTLTADNSHTYNKDQQKNLIKSLKSYLTHANIFLSYGRKEQKENNYYTITHNENSVLLSFGSDNDEKVVTFREDNLYRAIFELLIPLLDRNPEIIHLQNEFEKFYTQLIPQSNNNINISVNADSNILNRSIFKKKIHIFWLCLIILCVTFCAIFFITSDKFYASLSRLIDNKDKNQIMWNAPYLTQHHIPRYELINAVKNKLHKQSDSKIILAGLHGLGGVGKTTLATYLFHHFDNYSFKGWFKSETEELLKNDYFNLGTHLKLFTQNMSDEQKIIEVKKWLEKQHSTFLVYDNSPNMDILSNYLPSNGHVIITTRNTNVHSAIAVDAMSEKEAVQLLDTLISKSNNIKNSDYYNNLKELANILGYLPLALSQAGSYIESTSITVAEYLSLYQTEKDNLLSTNTISTLDLHKPVYVTWDLAIKSIQAKSPDNFHKIEQILYFISCCYPEDIPKILLEEYLKCITNNNAKYELSQLLLALSEQSLIRIHNDAISIHRLVHQWIKKNAEHYDQEVILKNGISAIKSVYPSKNNKNLEDINFIRKLLPHMEVLLSNINNNTTQNDLSCLLEILGDAQLVLGNYARSKQLFKLVLSSKEDMFGQKHIKIADTLVQLGVTEAKLGNYHTSKKLLKRALSINIQHFNQNTMQVINNRYQLASVYRSLGKFHKSKTLLEQALHSSQEHFGHNHVITANILHQLGSLHVQLNEYAKSENILNQALSIKQNILGNGHIDTAQTLFQLGSTYNYLGKYNDSKKLLTQALQIHQTYFGADHIETIYILHKLGITEIFLGNYNASRALLENTMQKKINLFEPSHPEMAYTLHQLAYLYIYFGEYSQSIKYFQDATNIKSQYFSNTHLTTIYSMHQLGNVHVLMGNYDQAIELLKQSLKNSSEYYNIYVYNSLGIFYFYIGDVTESQKSFAKALLFLKKHYTNDNIFTLSIYNNASYANAMSGNINESQQAIKDIYTKVNNMYSKNSIFVAKCLINLGNIERLLKNYKESKILLEQGFNILNKYYSYDKLAMASALGNLGLLNGAIGNVKEKQHYLDQAISILEQYVNSNHVYLQNMKEATKASYSDYQNNIGYHLFLLY